MSQAAVETTENCLIYTYDSSEIDTIDTYWVPQNYIQSERVLNEYSPAGVDESSIDYDISVTAASLIQVCG